MDKDNTRKVCEIFEKYNRSKTAIGPEIELGDLNLNSILFIHALLELETLFNISFEAEYLDMAYFKTIDDIIHFIEK